MGVWLKRSWPLDWWWTTDGVEGFECQSVEFGDVVVTPLQNAQYIGYFSRSPHFPGAL